MIIDNPKIVPITRLINGAGNNTIKETQHAITCNPIHENPITTLSPVASESMSGEVN